jgi:hypothetical protein
MVIYAFIIIYITGHRNTCHRNHTIAAFSDVAFRNSTVAYSRTHRTTNTPEHNAHRDTIIDRPIHSAHPTRRISAASAIRDGRQPHPASTARHPKP